jgi:hypothetical protein
VRADGLFAQPICLAGFALPTAALRVAMHLIRGEYWEALAVPERVHETSLAACARVPTLACQHSVRHTHHRAVAWMAALGMRQRSCWPLSLSASPSLSRHRRREQRRASPPPVRRSLGLPRRAVQPSGVQVVTRPLCLRQLPRAPNAHGVPRLSSLGPPRARRLCSFRWVYRSTAECVRAPRTDLCC